MLSLLQDVLPCSRGHPSPFYLRMLEIVSLDCEEKKNPVLPRLKFLCGRLELNLKTNTPKVRAIPTHFRHTWQALVTS